MQAFLSAGTAVIISRELPVRDGYECGTYHRKGNTVCAIPISLRKRYLDSIVINEIQRQAEAGAERKR